MKKTFKVLTSLLMALAVMMSLPAAVHAAEPEPATVVYTGQRTEFVFAPGSDWSETDLFTGFKDVMPGDKIRQDILFTNEAEDCDFVRLYLKAVPRSQEEMPMTMDMITVGTDLLSKLRLKVYQGDKLLSDATADDAGGLTEFVPLGTFRKGQQTKLTAELEVPIELDNEYANCLGQIDWIFKVEALDDPEDPDDRVSIVVNKVWDDNGVNRPTQVKVGLYDGNELVQTAILNADNNWIWGFGDLDPTADWNVREIDVPAGYEARYEVHGADMTITNVLTSWGKLLQTGQTNWPIPVLGGLGVLLVVIGVAAVKKGKKNTNE